VTKNKVYPSGEPRIKTRYWSPGNLEQQAGRAQRYRELQYLECVQAAVSLTEDEIMEKFEFSKVKDGWQTMHKRISPLQPRFFESFKYRIKI
jgi:hypothetical protein